MTAFDPVIWNTALAWAIVLVSFALAMLTILMALGRHERSLWIIASAYNAIAFGFILIIGQSRFSPPAGETLGSCLLLAGYLFLAWGIRCFALLPRPWPHRFWAYLGSAAILMAAQAAHPVAWQLRAGTVSAYIILFTAEFISVLGLKDLDIRKTVLRAITFFLGAFIAGHLAMTGLLLASIFGCPGLPGREIITVCTLGLTLFFLVLWAGSIILMDSTRLHAEMQRKNELLQAMALKDELTGLFNRHSLDQTLTAEMRRQDRYRNPLSLIMMDLDHFKKTNDRFGHDVGDLVLTEVARRVSEALRSNDILFRWGGEEFVVLAPHTGFNGARRLAEKLRLAVSAEPVEPVGTVTASFGVSERLGGENRDTWFRRVDQALYTAKNNGRNRVEAFTPEAAERAVTGIVSIDWKQEWESGIGVIDDEHRELVRIGNELLNISLMKNALPEMEMLLNRLLDHIERHFSNEEAILARTAYPDLEVHRTIHRNLLEEAKKVAETFRENRIDPTLLFNLMVEKIVIEHMIQTDPQFFPYLPNPEVSR